MSDFGKALVPSERFWPSSVCFPPRPDGALSVCPLRGPRPPPNPASGGWWMLGSCLLGEGIPSAAARLHPQRAQNPERQSDTKTNPKCRPESGSCSEEEARVGARGTARLSPLPGEDFVVCELKPGGRSRSLPSERRRQGHRSGSEQRGAEAQKHQVTSRSDREHDRLLRAQGLDTGRALKASLKGLSCLLKVVGRR